MSFRYRRIRALEQHVQKLLRLNATWMQIFTSSNNKTKRITTNQKSKLLKKMWVNSSLLFYFSIWFWNLYTYSLCLCLCLYLSFNKSINILLETGELFVVSEFLLISFMKLCRPETETTTTTTVTTTSVGTITFPNEGFVLYLVWKQ